MSMPWHVDPKTVRLFREDAGWLCLSMADNQTWSDVQVLRAAPLSDPDHYISVLDRNGEEIAMITDPSELDAETRRVLREELDRRYMTVVVRRIHSARSESGVSYFDVETDGGRRDFVVQSIHESARWLPGGRLLLVDADGNRFEVPASDALDKRSARLLAATLE